MSSFCLENLPVYFRDNSVTYLPTHIFLARTQLPYQHLQLLSDQWSFSPSACRSGPIRLSRLFQPCQSTSDTCLMRFTILNYAHMPPSRYQHCDPMNGVNIIASLLRPIFASCSPHLLLSYLLTYGVIGVWKYLRIAVPSRHTLGVSWSMSGHELNVIAIRCGGWRSRLWMFAGTDDKTERPWLQVSGLQTCLGKLQNIPEHCSLPCG